jgi:cyclic beta-1,2-glucan synthetase
MPERSRQAMDAVMAQLVDRKRHHPPVQAALHRAYPQEPGYIKAYPPGVRENGGQYTHAATWVVYGAGAPGPGDDAWILLLDLLNPVNHAQDPEAADRYRVEPYVVAADVYGEGERTGRGGWTWYTGSAGWLYRAAVEGILGIRREGDRIRLAPSLPSAWPGFSARLSIGGIQKDIRVERDGDGYRSIVDGEDVTGAGGFTLLR